MAREDEKEDIHPTQTTEDEKIITDDEEKKMSCYVEQSSENAFKIVEGSTNESNVKQPLNESLNFMETWCLPSNSKFSEKDTSEDENELLGCSTAVNYSDPSVKPINYSFCYTDDDLEDEAVELSGDDVISETDFDDTDDEEEEEEEDGVEASIIEDAIRSMSLQGDHEADLPSIRSSSSASSTYYEPSVAEEEDKPLSVFDLRCPCIEVPTAFEIAVESEMETNSSLKGYYDTSLISNFTTPQDLASSTHHFAVEDRIFLRTILTLLTSDNPHLTTEKTKPSAIIIKSGPLKKYSSLTRRWKVKFVELRPGMLTYYEDDIAFIDKRVANIQSSQSRQNLLQRKDIPLNSRSTICQLLDHMSIPSSVVGENSKAGFVFEILSQEDSDSSTNLIKKLWMANTQEELSSWLDAIQDAIDYNINGTSSTRNRSLLSTSTSSSQSQRNSLLEAMLHSHFSLYKAQWDTFSDEVIKMDDENFMHKLKYQTFSIPLPSLLFSQKEKRMEEEQAKTEKTDFLQVQEEENITNFNSSLLWEYIPKQNVTINFNGVLFPGTSPFVTEQLFGALVRCLLQYSKLSCTPDENLKCTFQHQPFASEFNTEIKAITFARDIMLSCCRYLQIQGRAAFGIGHPKYSFVYNAVTDLIGSVFGTDKFSVQKMNLSEIKDGDHTINIEISSPSSLPIEANELEELQENSKVNDFLHAINPTGHPSQLKQPHIDSVNYLSGWVMTKIKSNKRYKKRFCILSDNVLSFFEYDMPKPHGLRWQVIFHHDTIINLSSVKAKQSMTNDNDRIDSDTKNDKTLAKTRQRFVITVLSSSRDRMGKQFQMYFDNSDEYNSWNISFHSLLTKLQTSQIDTNTSIASMDYNDFSPLPNFGPVQKEKHDFQDMAHASIETLKTGHLASISRPRTTAGAIKSTVSGMVRKQLHKRHSFGCPPSVNAPYSPTSTSNKHQIVFNDDHAMPPPPPFNADASPKPLTQMSNKKKFKEFLSKKEKNNKLPIGLSGKENSSELLRLDDISESHFPVAQITVSAFHRTFNVKNKNGEDQLNVSTKYVQHFFLFQMPMSSSRTSSSIRDLNENECVMRKGEEIVVIEFA